MLKIFIRIRKRFILQPKWRILRIYTKTIPKRKIIELKENLKEQLCTSKSEIEKTYIEGELDIINLLLK